MATETHTRVLESRLGRYAPRRSTLLWGALVVNTQLLLLALFVAVSEFDPTWFMLYPVVWISVGLWAFVRVDPPDAPSSRRLFAGAAAAAYLLVLFVVGGVINPGTAFVEGGGFESVRLALVDLPPGWAPALLVTGTWVSLSLLPPLVIGYAALAYLLYAALLDATRGVFAGALGLFSCLSCTLPILAAGVAAITGGSGGLLLASVWDLDYRLSTVIFLLTVALLYWRPLID